MFCVLCHRYVLWDTIRRGDFSIPLPIPVARSCWLALMSIVAKMGIFVLMLVVRARLYLNLYLFDPLSNKRRTRLVSSTIALSCKRYTQACPTDNGWQMATHKLGPTSYSLLVAFLVVAPFP